MIKFAVRFLGKVFGKIGSKLVFISEIMQLNKSKLLERGVDRNLYRTSTNMVFWLNTTGHVDKCIINSGVFEKHATELVMRLIKEDDIVLDIGANIGYYSVILSKLVGPNGKVFAFEPTVHFGRYLRMTVEQNDCVNVEIYQIGLSNKSQEIDIDIGESSATLHSEPLFDPIISKETIKLTTLDEFIDSHPQQKIDFIKIDVDGHEPLFFEGAWRTLDKYDPIILLEVSHLHYLNAGFTAWDFYDLLKYKKYRIYNEHNMTELKSKEAFLIKCGNFSHSANIVISKRDLSQCL